MAHLVSPRRAIFLPGSNYSNVVAPLMNTIFVVFAFPFSRPCDRDFLAAYSTPQAAQRFLDAQDVNVRENLRVVEVELNNPPPSDGFWIIPK